MSRVGVRAVNTVLPVDGASALWVAMTPLYLATTMMPTLAENSCLRLRLFLFRQLSRTRK